MHNTSSPNIAYYETPYGQFLIETADGAITGIDWEARITRPDCRAHGACDALTDRAFHQLIEYFEGKRTVFDLPLAPEGTAFQKEVWNALAEIPYGQTRSYAEIAAAVGRPRAYRAVGAANNRNPIAIVIPCHRVIGADGSLTGYASGLDAKRTLLQRESAT